MLKNDNTKIDETLEKIKIKYNDFDNWLAIESRKPLPELKPIKIDSDRVRDLKSVVESLPLFDDSAYQFVLSSTEEDGRLVPIDRLTKAQLVNETEKTLAKFDGVNVSWTPNVFKPFSRSHTIDDLGFINALYLDFDVEKAGKVKNEELPKLMKYLQFINFEPSLIIDSGHGFYCYWVLSDGLKVTQNNVWAVKKLGDQLKGLVVTMKKAGIDYVDGNVSNLNHNMRLPGSVNYKNEDDPRPVSLAHESGITYDYVDLCAGLAELQPLKKSEKSEITPDVGPTIVKASVVMQTSDKKIKKVKPKSKSTKNPGQSASGKRHNEQQNKDFLADFITLSKLRGRAIDGHRHNLLIQAYIRGARDLVAYNRQLSYPMDESGVKLLQKSMDGYAKSKSLKLPKKSATLIAELGVTNIEASHMKTLVPVELANARAKFGAKLSQLINTAYRRKIKLYEVLVVKKSRKLSATKLAKQLGVTARTVERDKNMDVTELAKHALNTSHETLSLIGKAIDNNLIDGEMIKPEVDLINQDTGSIGTYTKSQTMTLLADERKKADEYKKGHARFNR